MNLPKGFAMHPINDYLNQHPDLTASEFRILYFCLHADFGRLKNGVFWHGAKYIAEKTHCDRETVRKALEKFNARGWITDHRRASRQSKDTPR